MSSSLYFCAFMLLLGTFISSISQVMLKKAADRAFMLRSAALIFL